MLSSVLVYTQKGELDEQYFLDFFHPVAHLHKILKRDVKEEEKDDSWSGDVSQLFCPSLVCVMRDYSPKEPDLKHLLERVLTTTPGRSSDALRKNRIQECVRTLFKQADCFALPVPSDSEFFDAPWKDLNPTFQHSFNKMMAGL